MRGTREGELLPRFGSTDGGVMTEEAGAVTGSLKLLTHLVVGGGIGTFVRYVGAGDWSA